MKISRPTAQSSKSISSNRMPNKLKKQVAEILVDECGMPELVPAEFGGTKDGKEG